ncbi:MAG TPA: hypothetical protein VD707_02200 [Gemmatimonadales bacterium]|jgi:hypothetical protein|nr:hypothetical protein [Gemmatimonadales bacterium]
MKMVLIIYSGRDPRIVTDLLDQYGAGGYTALERGRGVGTTGRREGTRAWPGDATLVFSVVPPEQAADLEAALRAAAAGLAPGERLHAAVLPIETFF